MADSNAAGPSQDPASLSWLDRGLGLLTVVRGGEGASALLLAFNVCLLLCAYYVLKPVREALILSGGGAEIKSYAAVGQVLLLALIVPGYSWLVNHFDRAKLIRTVTFIFVGCLVAFYFAAKAQMPGLGIVFFLWVGIFNLMVVAQFWAFASDLYSREQGERLFPIVAFGASSGAVAGSQLTSLLVGPLGVPQMLLVSGALLLCALLLTLASEYFSARAAKSAEAQEGPSSDEQQAPKDEETNSGAGAFQLVIQSPYLRLIGVLMLLTNLVNTTGEFLLGSFVAEQAARVVSGDQVKVWIGQFYSNFYFWVNLLGAFIQLVIAPRFIRHLGVRVALLVLPAVALFGYLAVAFLPVLWTVRWAKTGENAFDYSLNNTVRNALFLPLTAEEKYKAKQVVDTIFVRAGDVFSAGLVFVGLRWLHAPLSLFAAVNAALVVVWLFVAFRLGKAYVERAKSDGDEPGKEPATAG